MRQAGAEGKVKVAAYEGAPQEFDSIRAGDQAVTLAGPDELMGWMAADELNRAWHGLPALNVPVQYRLFDGANIPDTEGYLGDIDFRSKYLKLWQLD